RPVREARRRPAAGAGERLASAADRRGLLATAPILIGAGDQVGVDRLHLALIQQVREAGHAFLEVDALEDDVVELAVRLRGHVPQVLDPTDRALAVADGASLRIELRAALHLRLARA